MKQACFTSKKMFKMGLMRRCIRLMKSNCLRTKKSALIVLCWLLCVSAAISQQTVKGVVSDSNGEPMIGATVIIKGTQAGTATGVNGEYSISVKNADAVLEFKFLGYLTQTKTAGNLTNINVVMTEDVKGLDEIVLIGYGSAKRSDLTGSVSSVKIDKLQSGAITSPDAMIQGKAAGVYVNATSGAPGSAINVRIRGTATLNAGSEPLYVVDGIVMETAMEDVGSTMTGGTNSSSTQETQNGLTSINPQDIASIEILKDASATAIYGSRGTNGVVLITTKKGISDKAKITFNSTFDVARISRKTNVLNGTEYASMINEREEEAIYDLNNLGEQYNWQDYMSRDAVTQNYRLSASGKNGKASYYLAGGYINNQGIIKNTGLDQLDMRLNATYDFTEKLKANFKYSTIRRVNNSTTGNDAIGNTYTSLIRQMVTYPPIVKIDEDYEADFLYTPKAWLTDYVDKSIEFRNTLSLGLDYKINDIFTFHLLGGYDNRNKERSRWYGTETYIGASANGQLGIADLLSESLNLEALLNFDKTFATDHHISGTVGITYDKKDIKTKQMVNENFFTEDLGIYGMGYGEISYPVNVGYSNYKLFSTLARAIYSYKEKYLVTLTGRLDGSSKFAPDNRYSFFPSVATAWRVNQEEFMQEIEQISNLKLRIGWGQTGNQAINPFKTQNVYTNGYYSTATAGLSIGMYSDGIANKDLVWETTSQANIGIDLGMFNNKLNLTIEAYNKITSDMLQDIEAALSSGFETITVNKGSIQNRGIELSLDGYILNDKDFSWNLGGNISFNRNKIVDLGLEPSTFGTEEMVAYYGSKVANDGDIQIPANIFIEGQPVGLFWGYATNSIYQDNAEANQYTYGGVVREAGDVRFIDQDDNKIIDASDEVVIGDYNPDFTYGINSTFSYKNLSLNVNFYGSYGNDILNANLAKETSTYYSTNVRKEAYYEAWRSTAPSNTYPRLNYRYQEISDRFIEDGSFLRLGTLTIGYSLPIKKSNLLSSVDLSLTGRNLFVITNYSGYDPEVNSFSNDPTRIGIDWGSYPSTKAVSFGIGITF